MTGDEYVFLSKLNREYSCFLNEIQKTTVVSIQQTDTETDSQE